MSLTPEQRTMRARIAANAKVAQGKTDTQSARDAFNAKFEREVDPDQVLPLAERAKRAEAARKAYFGRLALRSSIARSKGREFLCEAELVDRELGNVS
jgi:hypothetical protein